MSRAGVAARRGGRRGRIGLALAGGGPVGGVYEIGALCALQESLDGVEFTTLGQYVGVSAGAVVAACLANGITPRQQARAIVSHVEGEPAFVPERFFVPAYGAWAKRAAVLPMVVAEAMRALTTVRGRRGLESLERAARLLPAGIFTNEGVRDYLARLFARPGRTDDFRQLERKLTVVASDLESGRRILFGGEGWDDVPISRAVQASTAVPGLFAPVQVAGRFCVDGVLLKTVHASVALERGVKLLFSINPIVPVDLTPAVQRGELRRGTVVRAGLPAVLSQTFRTLVHSRMEVGMERYAALYPDADILLFEPPRDDLAMFFGSIFSFASRRTVCELAYEHTRQYLREHRHAIGRVLARHGIRLRMDVLHDHTRTVWGAPAEWNGPIVSPFRRLEHAIAALERDVGAAD